jgi:hypothetical protein
MIFRSQGHIKGSVGPIFISFVRSDIFRAQLTHLVSFVLRDKASCSHLGRPTALCQLCLVEKINSRLTLTM